MWMYREWMNADADYNPIGSPSWFTNYQTEVQDSMYWANGRTSASPLAESLQILLLLLDSCTGQKSQDHTHTSLHVPSVRSVLPRSVCRLLCVTLSVTPPFRFCCMCAVPPSSVLTASSTNWQRSFIFSSKKNNIMMSSRSQANVLQSQNNVTNCIGTLKTTVMLPYKK